MSQSALYSEKHAHLANLSLSDLGLSSWAPQAVKALQEKVGAEADGWLGPKSIKAWKAWAKKNQPQPVKGPAEHEVSAGHIIINGVGHKPPCGVKVVNFLESGGIPAQTNDTNPRKHEVFQFVLHRGFSGSYKPNRNYAERTEAVLDSRGLSTTFSQDTDGVIYQHFDPAIRRGRHAANHNVQSDSLDVGGPFSLSRKPAPGQTELSLKMAIGRENDGKPPLKRGYATVKCWSMPQAQIDALALFLPWYCELRGIPVKACEDWRCFRVGGLDLKDPVTNVKGILAHTQVSDPGRRVDGILPLHHLKEAGAPIEWRSGDRFFD